MCPADDIYQDDSQDELPEEKKKDSSEFARMLDESFQKPQKKLSPGDKVKAEVLVVGKDEIFVSTGTMHDGQVPRRELVGKDGQLSVKVGDKLDLYVTQVRGSEILLSPNPTAKNIADDLEDAFDMMLPVEGRVTEICKGGFRVAIRGKSAFCPISQMDTKRTETGEEYVGQRFEFLITQFSEGGRNIVVSRRKYLEEQRAASEAAFEDEHKPGELFRGRVTRVEKFGAFVEIKPGVEGLVHVSELSWGRLADAHEGAAIGQELEVKLLKVETVDGRLKISLSAKQAGEAPWENLPGEIRVGAVIAGKVTKCMKFGAFVQLVPGVEGLVPMSEMSYTKRVMRSDELMKEGERVTVMVKELNPDTRKILLSLKDAGSDPWALVHQKFPVGAIITGKIERKEPYGLFVQLEEGVTGLLPKSKAQEHPEFPFEKLRVGETTTVQVAEIRQEERRISLSVPQDPGSEDWKKHVAATSTGSFGTLGDKFKGLLDKKKK